MARDPNPTSASGTLRGRVWLSAALLATALVAGNAALQVALALEVRAEEAWRAQTALDEKAERLVGAGAHLDAVPAARRGAVLSKLEAAIGEWEGAVELDAPNDAAAQRLTRSARNVAQLERAGDRSEVSAEIERLMQLHVEWAAVHEPAVSEARAQLDARHRSVRALSLAELALSLGALAAVGLFVLRPRLARVERTLRSLSRVQDSLRESEAQKDAMLRAIPDAIFRLTRDGEVLAATQSYSTDEPRIPAPLRESINRACRETVDTRAPTELERQIGSAEQARHVEVRIVPCGRAEALAILRDVTERKRLERDLIEISDREQTRMGQDLHDGLCQHLAGVGLITRSTAARAARGEPVTAEQLDRLGELTETGLQLARAMSRGLYPAVLEQRGLRAALEDLCVTATTLHQLTCEATIDAPSDPPRGASLQLYRIAQEALANAVKHARASRVTLDYAATDDRVRLEVRDDGRGLAASPRQHGHTSMGLRIMRSRARVLGTEVHVESKPNEGTVVWVEVERHRLEGLDDDDSNTDNVDDPAS